MKFTLRITLQCPGHSETDVYVDHDISPDSMTAISAAVEHSVRATLEALRVSNAFIRTYLGPELLQARTFGLARQPGLVDNLVGTLPIDRIAA